MEHSSRCKSDISPRAKATLEEWRSVLDGPIDGVIALLIGEDERAARLRQSHPFAGALPQKIRNEILLRFEARDKEATRLRALKGESPCR